VIKARRFGVCKKVKTNIPTRAMSSEWCSLGRTVDGSELNVTMRSQAQRFFFNEKTIFTKLQHSYTHYKMDCEKS
jgi:hypothetical protein